MDKFTSRKYIRSSEFFFLRLILRLFFSLRWCLATFDEPFIVEGVCVWRVNVRREPETASFLIAVPIVIATVDV